MRVENLVKVNDIEVVRRDREVAVPSRNIAVVALLPCIAVADALKESMVVLSVPELPCLSW